MTRSRCQQPTHPDAGWVVDNANDALPSVDSVGTLTIIGDSRVYLVQDYTKHAWGEHKYIRIDMSKDPLRFTLDLSNVPCGCLACIYLVSPISATRMLPCARSSPANSVVHAGLHEGPK